MRKLFPAEAVRLVKAERLYSEALSLLRNSGVNSLGAIAMCISAIVVAFTTVNIFHWLMLMIAYFMFLSNARRLAKKAHVRADTALKIFKSIVKENNENQ